MISSMTANSIIHHQNSPSSSTSILTSAINNNNHVSASTPANIKTSSSSAALSYHLNSASELSASLKRKNLYNSNQNGVNISTNNQLLNLLPQNNSDNDAGLLVKI